MKSSSKSPLLENDGQPLYVRVGEKLKAWIHEGQFLPGDKVPSVREMSTKLRVSVSTVLQSYDTLEAQGVIEARPQSGYYVKLRQDFNQNSEIKSNPRSAPRFIESDNAILDVIRSCGDSDLISLGSAVIHWSLLPSEALQKSLIKVARENIPECMKYEKGVGAWSLRQLLAQRSAGMGCDVATESVLVTNGCMEAINLALKAVTKPGDTVAVESPSYYGILRALESLNLKILELPTSSQQGLDIDTFEEKLKKFSVTAALVTPSFLNPLGSFMPDEKKERLVQLCAKYGVTLIEDDIYAELKFQGSRPLALKSFDKKDQVIYCSSFSKSLSPGYRVGWIIPPRKLSEKIEILKASLTVTTNSPAQLAIADFLQHHNYERSLRKLRQTLAQNMCLVQQKVKLYFPEGTKVTQPEGGCLLWVEFPNEVKGLELHRKALKEKISVIPGPVFSANSKYQNCVRLNCGNPWSEKIDKALLRVGQLAHGMM